MAMIDGSLKCERHSPQITPHCLYPASISMPRFSSLDFRPLPIAKMTSIKTLMMVRLSLIRIYNKTEEI